LSLEAFIPKGHFRNSDAEILLLGAGGSSLALTMYLINKAKSSTDVPKRIIVSNRSEKRLEEMQELHSRMDYPFEIAYKLRPSPDGNDALMLDLPDGSLVVNATGLGKDAPGSPITNEAIFPKGGYAWEFNYRGNLVFLDQARKQCDSRGLKVEDGWVYFIHGWTRVIEEVFHIDIPISGPVFDALSDLAATERS
jgi:shikimate 5-dehydrogenase